MTEKKRLIPIAAGAFAAVVATLAVVAVLAAGGSGDREDNPPATQHEAADDDVAAEPRDGFQVSAPQCVEGAECEDVVMSDGEPATVKPAEPAPEDEGPLLSSRGVCDDVDMNACQKLAVDVTVADLADRLGIDEADVSVVSVEFTEWSDTSLGNPQPGFLYAQVITPGFNIVLEANGQSYEYHTDLNGNFTFVQ
jgi:hypothetical protein